MTDSEQIVYINCVEEVRYSFVSHLSEALRRKGIHDVFVDCDDLLSDESQSKVERARVSVMVLPVNHKVNLDKLVKVLECQKNKDQVVVPVLYGVRSLEIEWLSALDSKGFSSVHYSRKEYSDSQLVKEIVRDVYEKLFHMGRIGIYSKLLEIEKMVCKQLLDIRCVGIWGMPGIGKTTLAKAVFDQMSGEFDAYCFIEDYTKAIQEKGLYCLLEEQFLQEKAIGSDTITKLSLLRDKLNNKRVLVVLDDVHNPLAVESFRGGFDWFGPKSLIIITSRDKQVFRLCRVNQIYEVQGLNEKEALQLFSLCASIDEMAEQNLHEVSMKVIKYANGHPLALNLYGRELKDKKRPPEMERAFLELKVRPPDKFVDAIKSSYETLNDSCRNIFLDIACFFHGENIDYVIQLLEGCGYFPHVGIDILVEKCLVTVSENRVCMHNLIQDVGRQIGRHSRLWEPWSIKYLLEVNEHNVDVEPKATLKRAQSTEEIEGMFLDTSNLIFDIKPAAFDNMLNLRLLKIYSSNPGVHPVISFPKGSLYSLPNELRLLHWENYPLQFLPLNFDPMHLVEINMPYSQLKTLWGGTKNLEMLRTIRLCHSQQLVNIDDLLKAQNLEVVDLQGCTRLQSFPATGQLLHLRVINLSGCTEIKSFPEIPPNIETLHLQRTGITELQLSIVKPNYRELLNLLAEIPGLSGVSNLEQSDLKPLTSLMKMGTSNQNLCKLIHLELKDCSSLRSLPDMDNLELIKVLDLSGCLELETIQGFPRNLKELYLAGTAVRQVPQLPQSLQLFNAHGCVSLKSIRLDFNKLPVHYTFSNCFDLSPQVVSDFLVKALANAQHIPRERQELNEAPTFSLCVPSHANLNSTLDLQPGSSVMTQLNPSWRNTLVGFAMLVEVAFSEDYCDATGFGIRCVCRWKNKKGLSDGIKRNVHCWAPGKAVPKVQKDHVFVFCDVNMHPSTYKGYDPDICVDLVVFEFFPIDEDTELLDSCIVRRCGVRVITDANCNTSIENMSPVLDPMEVSGNEGEEVLRINYDGLQEIHKALFLYIAGLFNHKEVDFVAPHIANIIDMDVSNGLKVLADMSLIRVSSNGEIVMPCLPRQMGTEILSKDRMKRLGFLSGNNMNRAKRILDGNDDDQPERKRPALASVIVEALKVDSLQKLCSSLEPNLRRVVSEEVERALAKLGPARLTGSSGSSPKRIEGPDGRNLRLHFKSRLSLPLFTGGKVEGEQGAAIHVVLIDANSGRVVVCGPEASAKLQVVVLEGDFNGEDDEDWTQEEFESHVVKERAGKRPLLTGDVYVTLKEGVGTLGELVFTDNSSWIRSRKFRLGLRVVPGYCDGMRIREAKTEAFIVKDHRGKLYKKHYPPALTDEVWRLEKIGKDGAFHKKLNTAGIETVEDFLRLMVRDSAKLRTILGSGMSNKMWDALVEHAKTCVQSSKLYIYYAEDSRNVGVVFNNIYELSGLISGDQYFSADSLTDSQKVYVEGLVKKAYENWNLVIEYDGKSLLDLKQPTRLGITQTDLANYPTAAIDHPMQMAGHSSSMPANQSPVLADFAIGGYDQTLATRYHSHPQLLNSNPRAQFDVASCSTTQDQLMGNLHQTQNTINNQNMNVLALGPPQSSTSGYQNINSSVHQANLNHIEDWSNPRERGPEDFFSEQEIRLRSHEMLEREDMQQFLRLFSMGGGGNGSATHLPEDGYTFPSFLHTPMQGYDEDSGRSGRAVVGWLKIKAAMRWGFFIRRKAAERRAQIVELDDDDEDGE